MSLSQLVDQSKVIRHLSHFRFLIARNIVALNFFYYGKMNITTCITLTIFGV
jgi:hypothetical protein